MGKYCLLLASTRVDLSDNLPRELKQQRRRRQRERHKTKGLVSKIISSVRSLWVFVQFFLPSSAKQQREMTKFKVFCRTRAHDSEFLFL